jgi:hypothetical protein
MEMKYKMLNLKPLMIHIDLTTDYIFLIYIYIFIIIIIMIIILMCSGLEIDPQLIKDQLEQGENRNEKKKFC